MPTATIPPQRLRSIVRTGLKRASGLRLALLAALAVAVTLAASVAPARPARSAPAVQRLALAAPVGAVTKAYVDAVAPAPQPESSNTPSLETVLNPDGSLRGGLSGSFNAEGYAIAYGADGGPRFVPSGSSAAMADGYANSVDNLPNNAVRAIAVSGSDVYVGGLFADLAGIAEADRIAKWDGSAWSALGGGAQNTVFAIAVSGSDVYVGGLFTSVYSSGTTEVDGTLRIAKWNGSAWSALGGGAQSDVRALAVSGSDVYVGGVFSSVYSSGTTEVAGTVRIAKWDGSAWSALGGGAQSSVFALAVSGSDVYVGGGFTSVYSSGTTPVAGTGYIAKWNGSAWSALGGGAVDRVLTFAVSGSDVYVGGQFTSVYSSGTTPVTGARRIAKWNGSAWSAAVTAGNGVNSAVIAIAVSGSDVYVGGGFTDLADIAEADRIAKWDGSAWSALGGGAQNTVFAIAVSGSDVYVGGGFTSVYSSGTTTVDGTLRIAKWDGSAWSALGGGAQSSVYAIAVSGSDVYVGGVFSSVYSSGTSPVASTNYIAKWDGSAWSALGSGVNNVVNALALGTAEPAPGAVRGDAPAARAAQAAVPALYMGGTFTAAGDGTPMSYFSYYTGPEVLPVELVSFSGTVSGRAAHLLWTTASETNNIGFVVERQTGDAWTDVSAIIAGQGTTTERTDYAYDVTGLTAGRHTFRLRQTDTDGAIHHSASVTIEIGTDGLGALVTVLGNGSRTPKLRIEGSGAVRAEVFDVLGRSVATVFDGLVSGTAEARLPSLSSGSYVVRVTSDGHATSHAVVVR
ncbi:MAG: T9SS type A sorting domain-containing protein [Bacteroidetes bacterium]|nr:T9SS type A sorting domain-containing protein [Bacteroidota bacterium]